MAENVQSLEVCEQCGGKSTVTYTCNSCGMVVCEDCVASRGRTAPCHCLWDDCNGWLKAS